MNVVGEFLSQAQEHTLFAYLRYHFTPIFPAVQSLHHTTLMRNCQTASMWRLKERLWYQMLRVLIKTSQNLADGASKTDSASRNKVLIGVLVLQRQLCRTLSHQEVAHVRDDA